MDINPTLPASLLGVVASRLHQKRLANIWRQSLSKELKLSTTHWNTYDIVYVRINGLYLQYRSGNLFGLFVKTIVRYWRRIQLALWQKMKINAAILESSVIIKIKLLGILSHAPPRWPEQVRGLFYPSWFQPFFLRSLLDWVDHTAWAPFAWKAKMLQIARNFLHL